MDIHFNKNSAANNWEPHPWDVSEEIMLHQKEGFLEVVKLPLRWEKIDFQSLPLDGFFGMTAEKLMSLQATCSTIYNEEGYLLMEYLWAGWPDPPNWRLASTVHKSGSFKWEDWGYFTDMPRAWGLPDDMLKG